MIGTTLRYKVTGKDAETLINALIKHARKLPQELYQSLTWDRGKEMADHKRFTLATDIKVYFCDPQNPWQRGTNENTPTALGVRAAKGFYTYPDPKCAKDDFLMAR